MGVVAKRQVALTLAFNFDDAGTDVGELSRGERLRDGVVRSDSAAPTD